MNGKDVPRAHDAPTPQGWAEFMKTGWAPFVILMLPLLMVSETAQFQKERRARDLNPRRFPLPVFKTGALDRAMRRLQVVREVYRENSP